MTGQQRLFLWGWILVIIGLIVWGALASTTTPSGTNSSKTVKAVVDSDHTKGSRTAAVTIIEYSDFQCPACSSYESIVRQLTEKYGDKILFVYRHFPLTQLHANAQMAAQASEAAELQSKFWEFHDKLLDSQTSWSSSKDVKKIFSGYAKELGLDQAKFDRDINSQTVKDRIQADVDSGNSAKVNGTPSLFLNGKSITSPSNLESFSKLIDPLLTTK